MVVYCLRRSDFIFLQDLHWAVATSSILMKPNIFTGSIVYAGIFAVCLSYLLAHYLSGSLWGVYHDWSGWRSLTGNSPNQITTSLQKISWAMIFCSTWWMLWRLDIFISKNPLKEENCIDDKMEEPLPSSHDDSEKMEDFSESHRSENFIPEDDYNTEENNQANDKEETDGARKIIFPTVEELEMAEVLGLSKDDLEDFPKIKATYRSSIAQYHPDKVSALGAEIREVAEKKAKEINQAYEFFRKKFKN